MCTSLGGGKLNRNQVLHLHCPHVTLPVIFPTISSSPSSFVGSASHSTGTVSVHIYKPFKLTNTLAHMHKLHPTSKVHVCYPSLSLSLTLSFSLSLSLSLSVSVTPPLHS